MQKLPWLLIAVCIAVLAITCKSDEQPPELMPTLVIATSANTAVAVATPTRPPTATARETPPATPRSNLSFSFGPGVDAGDRAIIQNAVEVSRKVLMAEGSVDAPCTVLAYDTLTGLSQAYRRVAGNQAPRAPDVIRRLQNGVAEAGYRNVAIYTSSRFWQGANAVQRSQAVAHEYVHVVQLELIGERLTDQTFSTPADKVPPGGPFWLFEGSAELLGWGIIEELRLGNLESKLAEFRERAGQHDVRLDSMETYVGYVEEGPAGVATSVLGVAALLRNRTAGDLFRFWALIRSGLPWQVAFNAAFGTTTAEFYSSFEAGR